VSSASAGAFCHAILVWSSNYLGYRFPTALPLGNRDEVAHGAESAIPAVVSENIKLDDGLSGQLIPASNATPSGGGVCRPRIAQSCVWQSLDFVPVGFF
jgi:hypothetical protein